jgi:hypothetical protein
MALIDKNLVLSAAQSVALNATSANSTNVVDLGAPGTDANGNTPPGDLGLSVGVMEATLDARLVAALAGGTSLQVKVINDSDPGLATTPVVVAETLVLTAAGVAGYRIPIGALGPGVTQRYLGLIFTTVGDMTGGTINANLQLQRYP